MKKVYIANQSKQKLGGGFVFIDNLMRASNKNISFVSNCKSCSTYFIPSVTMVERAEVSEAKSAGKKIVLRIDNMPKDSRNRGTSFSRMKDYASWADVIVFQSLWAREYVGGHLGSIGIDMGKSVVIYNGVDTKFFNHSDKPEKRGETYLFTTFNTDENKRFPEAAYDFHVRHMSAVSESRPKPSLRIVGNFTKELVAYNFDFFSGEKISYKPPVESRKEMGDIYRSCQYIYFPAFADASPNTVGEAIACGCKVLLSNEVGGTREVIEQFSKKPISIEEMSVKYEETFR